MGWLKRGAVGVVTNAGARDTDELILIKAPVYTKYISRGIRPGRLRLESYNRPISCGGVLVFPGDVIVGDGDGVIVVPREKVIEAGKIARNINESDQKSRLKLYEDLGMPPDRTVEKYKEKK
jgi:regulator of RNase E activity RraA